MSPIEKYLLPFAAKQSQFSRHFFAIRTPAMLEPGDFNKQQLVQIGLS